MAPLTVENSGSFLLARGAVSQNKQEDAMQERKVKVLRAFNDHNKPAQITKVGSIISLPAIFAREMVAANKAEWVKEDVGVLHATPVQATPAKEPAKKEEAKHVK